MNIVILCDGDFPKHSYPLSKLKNADIIICTDASVLSLTSSGINRVPNYIVGDMDTLAPNLQDIYKDIIIKCSCQETNDQTKAYSFALGLLDHCQDNCITFLGSTGKREDHTLGNISLLSDYGIKGSSILPFGNIVPNSLEIEMISNYGIFKPYYNSIEIKSYNGKQISIFAFDNSLKIKSEGLLYKTDNVIFDLWWKVTLNEVTGNNYKLTFNHPSRIIRFEKH